MKNYSQPGAAKLTVVGNTKTGHYYWVGHCSNGIDYYTGQTFKTHRTGSLKNIRIFPEMIVGETDALLSVYEFDERNHAWKDKKAEKHLMLNKSMQQQWIQFDMNIILENTKQYAFKISCNHGGMMAIAECNWQEKDPYPDGEQWVGSSKNPSGCFYRNFDIAFAAEIESH